MIDPFTSGLTVVHVVQTIAQASALLYGYIASVRDADSTCQTLLDELSSIIGVLTTVTEIEKDPSLPDNLHHVLSKLMAENGPVTKLQRELKNLLPNEQESRKMGAISKLMWPFKEKKAAAITERLKGFYRDITTVLAIDSRSRNTLKEVDRGVKEVGRGVQELKEAQEVQEARKKEEERRKFLQWMNPVSCTEKHATSHGQRNSGTGRWIFHADEYKTWNRSHCAFLWLNGQPGHGKTILASSIIDEIQGSGEAELQTLGYFYCNFRDDRTTNAAAVLRSLIVQLLQQSQDDDWITQIGKKQESNTEGDLDSLQNLWEQRRDAKSHPTDLGFLRKLLVEVSALVRRPVLVIDALDECKDYPDLVGHLVNLAEDARLQLFVTSRSESDITKVFHDLPTISLKDRAEQMKEDIYLHITGQLKTQERLSRLPEALKKTILEKLSKKAEGMFRWVQCQLDVIMKCKRPDSIRKALDDLPAGLYETYDRIIHSIEESGQDDGPIAQRCLLLLAGTFTPLTLDQLNEAMMIEVGWPSLKEELGVTDTMDIVAACGSLVMYNEKTRVVALSHYSVKEYLISRPNKILKSTSDMHARICELLITYVLCDFVDKICAKGKHPAIREPTAIEDDEEQEQEQEAVQDHPLLSYAIRGWEHLRHVSDEDPDILDALSRLNLEFRRSTKKHRVLARRKYRYEHRWLPANVTLPSLLFIPIEHGKPWMVEFVVKQHPDLLDVDIAPGCGSPLIFAIAKSPDCLSILVKPGVDLNKLSSIKSNLYGEEFVGYSCAPISWAAVTGSEVAVDFLLSHREVDIPDDIMQAAIYPDPPSHGLIRKFRRRGADVNFTDDGYKPIHSFLSHHLSNLHNRHYDKNQLLHIVQALVEPSCNLSLQDRTARTVLHIALDGHLENIVTYLLEQNAGLSATATLYPDMWSWATNKTWFPKVQAAALAADQPCTRIKGKVVDTEESQIVEFSVAVTADRNNSNPICAVVVSAIRNSEVSITSKGHPGLPERRFPQTLVIL
ncbi:hypothetical protein EV702DRAFT_1046763 [Suillus placidus]|uniref:Nephrocystin 3-like N-terminal domain-containing protein n=1 Tax=Suillus placidus TaxID=48579 RepID=A0A9P6ZSG3_9AGAM|nr:hypothetical protein EV702DRAFT_1046763 [Suillus placidus]